MLGLDKGYSLDHMIEVLNKSCGTVKQNLKDIKKFASYVADEYFSEEFKLPKDFFYVVSKNGKLVKII